jgi:hypothetical protein
MRDAADQTEKEERNHYCRSRPVDSLMIIGECGRLTVFAGTLGNIVNDHDSSRYWAPRLDERDRIISPTIVMFFFALSIR